MKSARNHLGRSEAACGLDLRSVPKTQLLSPHCGVFRVGHLAIAVAPSTIHDFVRVRRRRGKRGVVFSGRQPASKTKRVLAASDWHLANQGESLGVC